MSSVTVQCLPGEFLSPESQPHPLQTSGSFCPLSTPTLCAGTRKPDQRGTALASRPSPPSLWCNKLLFIFAAHFLPSFLPGSCIPAPPFVPGLCDYFRPSSHSCPWPPASPLLSMSCSRSCQNPRKGAMPVPGPTKMQGKLGSGGSRKEGALAERHSVRLPLLPGSPFLMSLWRGGARRTQLLLIIELILVKCLQQCL